MWFDQVQKGGVFSFYDTGCCILNFGLYPASDWLEMGGTDGRLAIWVNIPGGGRGMGAMRSWKVAFAGLGDAEVDEEGWEKLPLHVEIAMMHQAAVGEDGEFRTFRLKFQLRVGGGAASKKKKNEMCQWHFIVLIMTTRFISMSFYLNIAFWKHLHGCQGTNQY
jgi:hypothetical protein